MRQTVLLEQSTFNDLVRLAIPLKDDADSVIARLIRTAKKNGHTLAGARRVKAKAAPGRGKGTPNGIGTRIGELIKKGWSNQRIFKAMKKEFPKSRIKGPASVVWYRSKFKRKTPGKAATTPGVIKRVSNPDKLSKFIRPKYRNMKYWEAAQKAFIAQGRQRLGILSLANVIFDFPTTPQKEDRINRAIRSLTVAIRGYNQPKVKLLFNEPTLDVYELKRRK